MKAQPTKGFWLWRVAVCTLAVVLGSILGPPLVTALGLEMPRPIGDFDPVRQFLLH